MRTSVPKGSRRDSFPGGSGVARLDRRTRSLVRRLRPGDIAVIDHIDLDRANAEAMVGAQVAAVINVAPSISGRYPNLGPQILLGAGIPLVDVDPAVFGLLREGDRLRIEGDRLWRDEELICRVLPLDAETVATATAAARGGMASQLEAFSVNAMEFIRREQGLLLDGVGMPPMKTSLEGRPVVIVTRTYDYAADLHRMKRFIRETEPVLIGVDAGADALLEAGYTPQVVLGDLDTMSDDVLCSGAEVIVRAPLEGRASGIDRLERLGVTCQVFPTSTASADAAMLLADARGARLIVTVGSHASLEEFLDEGHSSMASTFLTRLRVGRTLVDPRAVQRLYQSRVQTWQLLLVALAGLLAVALAVSATPIGQGWFGDLFSAVEDAWTGTMGWLW
ncbi:MAG: hypothetical protein GEU93_04005 [Propionibacteriales bacterium]|nr:hypothetical protein [Propionibacteriales bacterium]